MTTTQCGFAALVGQPNAGKSTLLNALVDWPLAAVTPKPQTTQRLWRGIVTRGSHQTIWVDSPGCLEPVNALQTYMHDQFKKVCASCDVLVHVVNLARCPVPEETSDLFPGCDSKKPRVLVLNQVDCLPAKQVRRGQEAYASVVGQDVPVCLVSARTREGLQQLQQHVEARLPAGPLLFDPDLITDASERSLTAECVRRQAMLQLHQELPYCVAVTIETFDERRRFDKQKPLVDMTAVLHVARHSQRAMVIGQGGKRIKAIGIAARKGVQRLLHCPVMLRLLVRVQPNWTKEARHLRKLGYAG